MVPTAKSEGWGRAVRARAAATSIWTLNPRLARPPNLSQTRNSKPSQSVTWRSRRKFVTSACIRQPGVAVGLDATHLPQAVLWSQDAAQLRERRREVPPWAGEQQVGRRRLVRAGAVLPRELGL